MLRSALRCTAAIARVGLETRSARPTVNASSPLARACATARCSEVAWPSAHLGPMGLEGAVRLGLRKELEAIEDEQEREERVREVTALAQENAKALNAAQLFELEAPAVERAAPKVSFT